MDIRDILNLCDRSAAYYELVSAYKHGSPTFRSYVIDNWDFGVEWSYPDQTRLACMRGETVPTKDRIEASLLYYVFSSRFREDVRESIIALAMIYNSCIIAGLEPEKLFSEIANMSPLNIKETLIDFIKRNPADKSLAAFMLKTEVNDNGEITIVSHS